METLIVHVKDAEQSKVLKYLLKVLKIDFISEKGQTYDEEFVKKIEESKTQAEEGKLTVIDTEDLWK